jgi:hypothetical protein
VEKLYKNSSVADQRAIAGEVAPRIEGLNNLGQRARLQALFAGGNLTAIRCSRPGRV